MSKTITGNSSNIDSKTKFLEAIQGIQHSRNMIITSIISSLSYIKRENLSQRNVLIFSETIYLKKCYSSF